MATRKTTKSTRPATKATRKRGSKKPRKLSEHVAKLSPSSLWSYAKYNKKLTALFVVLFVAIGVFVIYRSFAATDTKMNSHWNWSLGSGEHNSLENDLVIDNAPSTLPVYWSHQFYFSSAPKLEHSGLGYMGLQNAGGSRADGSMGKTAVFSVFGAAVAGTAGSCKVEPASMNFDGYKNLGGTSCRVPYDWSGGTPYRFKVSRGSTEREYTWWVGTVNGREIGRIKVLSSWGGLDGYSIMFTEIFGPNPPATCQDVPYIRARFSKPIADGVSVPSQPSSNLGCANSKVTVTPNGITQEEGIPPLPAPPGPKDCKADGTCPRCTIDVTKSGATWTAKWSSANLGTAKNSWDATLTNRATSNVTNNVGINGTRTVSPLAGVDNTYVLNVYDGWVMTDVSCVATVRPAAATPPPPPPPPPPAAYCNISVAKNSSGTWIGTWRTYNLGAALYGWDATLTNSATGNTTNNVGINSTRTLSPRVGYSNTYTLKIYDGWAVTSTQCSTTIKG